MTAILAGFFIFSCGTTVLASSSIVSATFNGSSQNITMNPMASGTVSIQVTANEAVKFTRLYICSMSQPCNGASGNYTKYFSQSTISDTIIKIWDGKNTAGTVVPEGEYRVMASMTEGTNDPVTQFVPHSIIISYSGQNTGTTTSPTDSGNASTTSDLNNNIETSGSSNSTNQITGISTHSDPEELSDFNNTSVFVTSAGRGRVVYVGTPIEFRASYKIPKDIDGNGIHFTWSFGDGFSGVGLNVNHTYKYAGIYSIVLNASVGEENSVSRTKVTVFSPEISLLMTPGGDVEIMNHGMTEINIGGWILRNSINKFTIADDTIITAGNKIFLSKEDTRIYSIDTIPITLHNPMDGEVARISLGDTSVATTTPLEATSTIITVTEAETLSLAYRKSIALKKTIEKSASEMSAASSTMLGDMPDKEIQDMTATVLEANQSSTTTGFWGMIFGLPISGFKFVASLFYNF